MGEKKDRSATFVAGAIMAAAAVVMNTGVRIADTYNESSQQESQDSSDSSKP